MSGVDSVYENTEDTELIKRALYSAGKSVSQGFADGIKARRPEIINTVARVCEEVVSEARRKSDICQNQKLNNLLSELVHK